MKIASLLLLMFLPSLASAQWHGPSCTPMRQQFYILSRPDADRLHKQQYDERKLQFEQFAREAPIENLKAALATNPEKLVQTIARDEINRRKQKEKLQNAVTGGGYPVDLKSSVELTPLPPVVIRAVPVSPSPELKKSIRP